MGPANEFTLLMYSEKMYKIKICANVQNVCARDHRLRITAFNGNRNMQKKCVKKNTSPGNEF